MSRITNQIVERNVQLQRELDNQRRELNSFASENAKLLAAASAQSKIETRRRVTQQQVCRSEAEYEAKLQEDSRMNRLNARVISQNQALATELDKQAAEDERKRREIQRICDEAPELRELEKALKLAYLNKERAMQCEEKIVLALREQERIQAIEDQMEADRLKAASNEVGNLKAKKEKCAEQRAVLQNQIREKQEQLEELERQKERDRELVNNVVDRINREDEEEFSKKKKMQAAAAQMIKNFEILRRQQLEAEAAAARAEEEAIMNYNKSMDERNQGVAAKKQAKKEEEDRIFKKIVEETERKRKDEEEFNNLRDMLWEEELEAKRERDAREKREKQYMMRREMMDANARMLVAKEELRHREMENEARMVTMMRQKFANDEAKERAEEEHRRKARNDYMKLIEQQKVERRHLYDKERATEHAEMQEAMRREEYRQRVIQEARKRLLLEHAAKLKGYLPNGVIANEEELALLNGK